MDGDPLPEALDQRDGTFASPARAAVPPPSLAEERTFAVGDEVEVRVPGRHGETAAQKPLTRKAQSVCQSRRRVAARGWGLGLGTERQAGVAT